MKPFDDRERTAYHEAGHAVLYVVLGLVCKGATIVPNEEELAAGSATHGGECPTDEDAENLSLLAPDSFWTRHAIACYSGAVAVRQITKALDWREGADSDFLMAADALAKVTNDEESLQHLDLYARRRAVVLVEHYRPEIEAVARALLISNELSGEAVRRTVNDSIVSRRAQLLGW